MPHRLLATHGNTTDRDATDRNVTDRNATHGNATHGNGDALKGTAAWFRPVSAHETLTGTTQLRVVDKMTGLKKISALGCIPFPGATHDIEGSATIPLLGGSRIESKG